MTVVLLILVLLLGLVMIPFGLPGTWIIAGAALGYSLLVPGTIGIFTVHDGPSLSPGEIIALLVLGPHFKDDPGAAGDWWRHRGGDIGMPNFVALYALDASLRYLQAIGVEAISRHADPLVMLVQEGLRQIGIKSMCAAQPDNPTGIVAFKHERSEEIHSVLLRENVHVMYHAGRIRIARRFGSGYRHRRRHHGAEHRVRTDGCVGARESGLHDRVRGR